MKVYAVLEYSIIEYEECVKLAGIFSSIEKAEAAILEYEEDAKRWDHHIEYYYEECELDKVWEDEE